MTDAHASNHETAREGREAVKAFLEMKGITSEEVREGQRTVLRARLGHGRSARLLVRTRKTGTWHAREGDGDAALARDDSYWVLVDLSQGARPEFSVVPDRAMRADIERVHAAYLQKHGGERPCGYLLTHASSGRCPECGAGTRLGPGRIHETAASDLTRRHSTPPD